MTKIIFDYWNFDTISTTKEEVLQQRIVAPCLASTNVSSRSAPNELRASKMYPNSIHPWDVFRQEVEKYKIDEDASPIKDEVSEIFYFSLDNAYCEASNEVDEQYSLNMNLSRALIRTGIVHSFGAPPKCFGRMNFCVMKDETNISIIC